MRNFNIWLFAVVQILLVSETSLAQTDAQRILQQVRNRVVALRVYGDPAPLANFPANEPPIWGTGFVASPVRTDLFGRQRIITAGHVVQKDAMWARRGGGPARTVAPWVLGHSGRTQVEGFRGVAVHGLFDIAQVKGPRNMNPIVIQEAPFSSSERYFVVSWGYDADWREPYEEPYIKEVKLVEPLPNEPPLQAGHVLLEIAPGQANATFKQSESGSPVLDINGNAVGIMIQQRLDTTTGVATRGIALQFANIASWVLATLWDNLSNSDAIFIASIDDPNKRRDYLKSVTGACLFLGKFSARGVEPGSKRALADAPAGLDVLERAMGLFPTDSPAKTTDKEAMLVSAFKEPVTLSIAPKGAINIRAHCPDVVPKPKRKEEWERIAYYGPVIAQADARSEIKVQKVLRQAYLKDYFYWGVIDSATDNSDR